MIVDVYVLCPKCGTHLKMKKVGWCSKPTCESCRSSFNVTVNSEEMKIKFVEIEYFTEDE